MKKRILSFVLAAVLLCGAVSSPAAAAQAKPEKDIFTDIAKSWAKKDILWAYENGIATGTGAATFSPSGSLSRGMFVCFLARLANLVGEDVTDYPDANPFADIKNTSKHWYYSAAAWAYDKGIVSGTAVKDGKAVFSPNNDITRQETASIFYRFLSYLGCKIGTEGAKTFPDGGKIQKWARESATALTAVGVFAGDAKGRFNPSGKADRATAVSLCRRIYDLIHDGTDDVPFTAYLPLNLNTDDLDGISLSAGKLHFDGMLTAGQKITFCLDMPDGTAAEYAVLEGEKSGAFDVYLYENGQIEVKSNGGVTSVTGGNRYAQPTWEQSAQQLTFVSAANGYTEGAKLGLGHMRFSAALTDGDEIVLPIGGVDTNLVPYFLENGARDGARHRYDVTWADGTVVRLYEDAKEIAAIAVPAQDALNCTVRVEGEPDGKVTLFREIDESPLARHGTLHVDGIRLADEKGKIFAPSGVHIFFEIPEYWKFATYETLRWIRDDWGVDTIRLGLILNTFNEGKNGYLVGDAVRRQYMYDLMTETARWCTDLGMYALIDWHGLNEKDYENGFDEGDPMLYADEACAFFDTVSARYAKNRNVLYELYNEPLDGSVAEDPGSVCYDEKYVGTKELQLQGRTVLEYPAMIDYAWERIAEYCSRVIPIIRRNDPDSVILAPTPQADQYPLYAAFHPLEYDNVVYTMHFYNGVHGTNLIDNTIAALGGSRFGKSFAVPVFVTECGVCLGETNFVRGESRTEPYPLFSFETWADQIMEKYQIGCIAFVLRDAENQLLGDAEGLYGWGTETLPEYGRFVREWYRRRAGLDS